MSTFPADYNTLKNIYDNSSSSYIYDKYISISHTSNPIPKSNYSKDLFRIFNNARIFPFSTNTVVLVHTSFDYLYLEISKWNYSSISTASSLVTVKYDLYSYMMINFKCELNIFNGTPFLTFIAYVYKSGFYATALARVSLEETTIKNFIILDFKTTNDNTVFTYLKVIGPWVFYCSENPNECLSWLNNDISYATLNKGYFITKIATNNYDNSISLPWIVTNISSFEKNYNNESTILISFYEKNPTNFNTLKFNLSSFKLITASSNPNVINTCFILTNKQFNASNIEKVNNTPTADDLFCTLKCYNNQIHDGNFSSNCIDLYDSTYGLNANLYVSNNSFVINCKIPNSFGYCEESEFFDVKTDAFSSMKNYLCADSNQMAIDSSTYCNSSKVFSLVNYNCIGCSEKSIYFYNSYKGTCFSECFDNHISCNYECVKRTCCIGEFLEENNCVPKCSKGFISNNVDETCFLCGDGFYEMNNTSCVSECLNNTVPATGNYVNDSNILIRYCKSCSDNNDGNIYYENYSCVSSCLIRGNVVSNNICSQCNSDLYELNNISCISEKECSEIGVLSVNPDNNNSLYCLKCQGNQVLENNKCNDSCSNKGYVADLATNKCSLCGNNNGSILFEYNNIECVENCSTYTDYYNYTDSNNLSYCVHCQNPLKNYQDFCVEECILGFIEINGQCKELCDYSNNEYFDFSTNNCSNNCYLKDNLVVFKDNNNYIKYCYECEEGLYIMNHTCVESCDNLKGYFKNDVDNVCFYCDIKNKLILGNQCLSACPEGYVIDDKADYLCIKETNNTSTSTSNNDNTSTDSNPPICENSYYTVSNKDNKTCVPCYENNYVLLDKQCISSCKSAIYEIKIIDNYNTCVLIINYENQCPKYCNYQGDCSLKQNGAPLCNCFSNYYGSQCNLSYENKEQINNQVKQIYSTILEDGISDIKEIAKLIKENPEAFSQEILDMIIDITEVCLNNMLSGKSQFKIEVFDVVDSLFSIQINGNSTNTTSSLTNIQSQLNLLNDQILEYFIQTNTTNSDTIIYSGEYISIQVSDNSINSINDARENNLPIIDFSNCERILKDNGILTESEALLSVNTNFDYLISKDLGIISNLNNINGTKSFNEDDVVFSSQIISYDIFDYSYGHVDTSICKDITVKIPVVKEGIKYDSYLEVYDQYGVDIYNKSSEFFSDVCFTYSKNDSDVTVDQRRDNYNLTSSCSNDCEYDGIDEHGYSICNCNPQVKTTSQYFSEAIYDNLLDNNIYLLRCFDQAFNKDIILGNKGNIVFIILTIISIIGFSSFYYIRLNSINKHLEKIIYKDKEFGFRPAEIGEINDDKISNIQNKKNDANINIKNTKNKFSREMLNNFQYKNSISSNEILFQNTKSNIALQNINTGCSDYILEENNNNYLISNENENVNTTTCLNSKQNTTNCPIINIETRDNPDIINTNINNTAYLPKEISYSSKNSNKIITSLDNFIEPNIINNHHNILSIKDKYEITIINEVDESSVNKTNAKPSLKSIELYNKISNNYNYHLNNNDIYPSQIGKVINEEREENHEKNYNNSLICKKKVNFTNKTVEINDIDNISYVDIDDQTDERNQDNNDVNELNKDNSINLNSRQNSINMTSINNNSVIDNFIDLDSRKNSVSSNSPRKKYNIISNEAIKERIFTNNIKYNINYNSLSNFTASNILKKRIKEEEDYTQSNKTNSFLDAQLNRDSENKSTIETKINSDIKDFIDSKSIIKNQGLKSKKLKLTLENDKSLKKRVHFNTVIFNPQKADEVKGKEIKGQSSFPVPGEKKSTNQFNLYSNFIQNISKLNLNELTMKDILTENDLNKLPAKYQISIDNRTFWNYFLETLKQEHKIISLFYNKSIIKPLWLRYLSFTLDLSLDFCLNALFYSSNIINSQFNEKTSQGKDAIGFLYIVNNEFWKSFWPVVITFIISTFIGIIVHVPIRYYNDLNQHFKTKMRTEIKKG